MFVPFPLSHLVRKACRSPLTTFSPQPRAAANPATRPSKPRADFSTVLVDSSADDPEPFPFTTNPPTPHATTAAKRAASKVKQNPRAKVRSRSRSKRAIAEIDLSSFSQVPRTARPPTESDEITPDDSHPPPVASTSRSRLTPPRQPGSDRAPLHQHETPVQVKNIAFRQGAGPGTPATAGRSSVRRGSARGSRNRGSSIGGGYDGSSRCIPSHLARRSLRLHRTAVPHPQVADDKLYRSTDAEDPLAKRLRSIVSWSAQRTRDKVFRSTPLDKLDDAQTIAKDVMNEFIADICSLKVDTSVPYQVRSFVSPFSLHCARLTRLKPSQEPSQSQDPEHLPPHPQNESNAAKMAELEESYAASVSLCPPSRPFLHSDRSSPFSHSIAAEQASRERLDTIYQSFFDRRATAHNAYPSTVYSSLGPPPAAVENLAKYAAALDLSRPAPKSLEEALELGKSLLRGEGVKKEEKTGGTGGKRGKGKEKVEESDGLDRQILDAQIDVRPLLLFLSRLAPETDFPLVFLLAHRRPPTCANSPTASPPSPASPPPTSLTVLPKLTAPSPHKHSKVSSTRHPRAAPLALATPQEKRLRRDLLERWRAQRRPRTRREERRRAVWI